MENNTSNINLVYGRILFIFEYIHLVIVLIGFIGNVFSIIIFSRRSLSKYSYSFYSRAMAISDVFLAFSSLIDWIGYNFGAHLEALGPFFCKIIEFMSFYFAGFSIHMLTIISNVNNSLSWAFFIDQETTVSVSNDCDCGMLNGSNMHIGTFKFQFNRCKSDKHFTTYSYLPNSIRHFKYRNVDNND